MSEDIRKTIMRKEKELAGLRSDAVPEVSEEVLLMLSDAYNRGIRVGSLDTEIQTLKKLSSINSKSNATNTKGKWWEWWAW